MGKLKFVFGPTGSGKTTKVHEEILKRAAQEPSKNFLVIVPDQFTMQTQRALSSGSETGGILNIDVLSFGRLTHRIMTEVGWKQLPVLDDTGKCLVLQRVAGRIADKLPVLGRRMDRQGYIHEVKSVISEFMQYSITPDKLDEIADRSGKTSALGSKLTDLCLIYREFLNFLEGNFITREEKLDILREVMPLSALMAGSVVVFDGFTGFTPDQIGVIKDILSLADETIVTLVLGEDKKIEECNEMQSLFYLSGKTYATLMRIAKEEGIEISEPEYCHHRGRAPEIEFLEKNLFRTGSATFRQTDKEGAVRLFYASNIAEEVHQAGIEICRLLQEGDVSENLQYRQIAIVSGDLEGYAPYFEREFASLGIPYYIDRTGSIRLNPLIEGVRSVLALFSKNFSAEAMFRYLRSGLSGITPEETDLLEVYVRELGIKGRDWSHRFARRTRDMDENDETGLNLINDIRERIVSGLEPLQGFAPDGKMILREGTKETAGTFVNRLYDYLLGRNAAGVLREYAQEFEREGDLVRQKEYAQIYKKFMELLEQIESLMGEDEISFGEFCDILDAGVGEIRIGTIPQTVDKVLIGDIERTRVPEVKVLFLLGVNDGNIPKNTDKGGIISDLERESIRENGFELTPTPKEEMFNQRLYLYMNMTKPTDRLYISWALLDSSGASLRPSYLCEVVKKMFPGTVLSIPEEKDCAEQIYTEAEGLRYLGEKLRLYVEGSEDNGSLYTLYSAYSAPENTQKRDALEKAAFLQYDEKNIDPLLAESLYCEKEDNADGGDETYSLRTSVSQLETYATCPYRFFLRYGLKLKETKEFEVDSRDTGNVNHYVLDEFAKKLKADNLSWKDFTDEYAKKTITELIDKAAESYGSKIFVDNARNHQSIYRLKKALISCVLTVRYQIKKGSFEPKEFEASFKSENDLPKRGEKKRKLKLVGRIDRVDIAEKDGKAYVRIVDFKSSAKNLDPALLYEGDQIQLPMYLKCEVDKLKKAGKDALPASMLYYHVEDPLIDTDADTSDETIAQKRINSAMMRGYTGSEDVTVSLNDSALSEKRGKSDVISVGYTAKGGFYKGSEVLEPAELETVMKYSGYVAEERAEKILDGDISISPIEKGSCEYCEFKASCSFDRKIPGYEKRIRSKMTKDEMIEKMNEAVKVDTKESAESGD